MRSQQPIIDRQIKLNSAIAQEGLDNNYGAQIGKTLMHVWGKSVTTRACARAAAGSDARMGGSREDLIRERVKHLRMRS